MSQGYEGIEAIAKVGERLKKVIDKPIPEATTIDQQQFASLMREQESKEALQVELSKRPEEDGLKLSPMEQASRVNGEVSSRRASREDLIRQTDSIASKMDVATEGLQVPNLELSNSVRDLMAQKLNRVDINLKSAMHTAGAEHTSFDESLSAQDIKDLSHPVKRFIGFLSHGQEQLDNLGSQLSQLDQETLTPASMLAVQIKVGTIQHEIELFANLLNQSLQSTKTVMNVQV